MDLANAFTWIYLILLVTIMLMSLHCKINNSMSAFKIITMIFSIVTLSSLIGISVIMAKRGFWI